MTHAREATLLALAALGAMSCSQRGPALRGHLAGLEQYVAEAEARGALHCAPRQFAIAQAELRFAALELDQGFASKASTHLARAELNARAAHNLSPASGCNSEPEEPAAAPADRDGDGIIDADDLCPDHPENFDGVEDHDGCPEAVDSEETNWEGSEVKDSQGADEAPPTPSLAPCPPGSDDHCP